MLDLILVRSCKMRAHRSVVTCDNDTTPSCGLLLIDPVFNVQALLFALLSQLVGVFVITHTANVPDAVWGKHVLCTTGGVLGSASCDDLCGSVSEEVVEEAHVLVFGEDGVVEYQAVLLEHGVVS